MGCNARTLTVLQVKKELDALGPTVTSKLVPLGKHSMNGEELQLPPVIFGETTPDPKKKTVLVYAHYVRI